MSIRSWKENMGLGQVPCTTRFDSWHCPNMIEVEGDGSLSHEFYACDLCGRSEALDYDDMQ